jgi:hypothetical protein
MIGASSTTETWSAGPSNRTCEGSYYQHPMSAADYAYQSAQSVYGSGIPALTGPIYYDEKGHCTPYSPILTTSTEWGIGSIILLAALAYGGYYLWTHRKKLGF